MGRKVNHDAAYKQVHTREECLGTTRSKAKVHAQTNSRPLNTVVETKSLRTERVYDWQKGTSENKPMDILTNARRQIGRAKISTVTSGRRQKRDESDTSNKMGYAVPSPFRGY